jgi:hypothetical protein
MGFKDKMMEKMMGRMLDGMSTEEKQEMMRSMMKEFMGTMSTEEKQGLMAKMMPEMMSVMMGGEGMPMMEMMSKCMSGDFRPPWITMEDIMGEVLKTTGFALVNTPELHDRFREFLDRQGEEVLSKITAEYKLLEELQGETKLSMDSLLYILLQLARKEEINLKVKRK